MHVRPFMADCWLIVKCSWISQWFMIILPGNVEINELISPQRRQGEGWWSCVLHKLPNCNVFLQMIPSVQRKESVMRGTKSLHFRDFFSPHKSILIGCQFIPQCFPSSFWSLWTSFSCLDLPVGTKTQMFNITQRTIWNGNPTIPAVDKRNFVYVGARAHALIMCSFTVEPWRCGIIKENCESLAAVQWG